MKTFGIDTQHYVMEIARIQARAGRAQMQITTGYRVNKASDAPGQLIEITNLQAKLKHAGHVRTNLERVQAEVNDNEATLRNAVKIVEQINVAGTQGADSQSTAEQRLVLAERVKSWHSELVRIANANTQGRYNFGGDQDQQAPYTLDWTQPGGVIRNQNSAATSVYEDAAGNRMQVSQRAQDIFDLRDAADDPATGNLFRAVHALGTSLEANDQAGVEAALETLRPAAEHLGQALAYMGNSQNKLAAAIEQTRGAELRATTALSTLRDADVAAAALELTQATTALEAALSAKGLEPRMNLFDYLA